MQNLFIFVPLLLFFIAYTVRDIYFATIVLMVSTTAMLAVERIKVGSVRKMHLYITGLLLVLGTVTVVLRNPQFIQWKVTIVHWLFAAILFGSQFAGKTPAVQAMMEMAIREQANGKNGQDDTGNAAAAADRDAPAAGDEQDLAINLSDSQWRALNSAWGGYFVFIGFLNLYIAYAFAEAVWVKFKVFGILGLQFVFLAITMAWMFSKINAADKRDRATDD